MNFLTGFRCIGTWFLEIGSVFLLWIVLHFIAANLYARFCAELSLFGFIKSILFAQSPHCMAMRWVIYNGATMINNMWISLGIWFIKKVFTNFLPNKE